MSLNHPIIAIVGAGAVGGYYGARLAQHGHEVHFLLRSDYDAVRQRGMTIRSCDGDFALPASAVHAHRDPATMPKADLVVITLKATANDQYEPLVHPLLKDDTAVLTLQNGLGNEDRLAELFGADRVLGGMAFVCINRTGPGEIEHTDHGLIRLGEFQGGGSARADRICALFNESKIHCQVLDNLLHGRWEKLIWNIPFNGLGAALDLTTDRVIATAQGAALVRSIMEEVIAIAEERGLQFSAGIVEQKIEHTRSMGAYKSSMQVDRQMGRAMEVDAIFGRPLAEANRLGVPAPQLELLIGLLNLFGS